MSIPRTTMRLLALAAATLWLGCVQARGQVNFAFAASDGLDGAVPRTSVQKYAKLLEMDKVQQEMALTLHEGYLEAHRATMKEMQAAIREFSERAREDLDFSVFREEMPRRMRTYSERMQELQKTFLGDVKALLNDEQQAQWPRVERMRRRETALRMGMVSGASVDVVEVATSALGDAPGSVELRATLDRYELEIDRAIQDLERLGKELQEGSIEAAQRMDLAAIRDMTRKLEEASVQIRDINREFARVVMPLLPGESRERFNAEIKRRSFPQVYRTSHVAQCLEAADGFADLTPEQRETIQSIRQAYGRESAAANEAWARAIEEQEETQGGRFSGMFAVMSGEGPEGRGAVSEARRARRELDNTTYDKLLTVLNDAQESRLPKRDQGRQSGQDFDVWFRGAGGG